MVIFPNLEKILWMTFLSFSSRSGPTCGTLSTTMTESIPSASWGRSLSTSPSSSVRAERCPVTDGPTTGLRSGSAPEVPSQEREGEPSHARAGEDGGLSPRLLQSYTWKSQEDWTPQSQGHSQDTGTEPWRPAKGMKSVQNRPQVTRDTGRGRPCASDQGSPGQLGLPQEASPGPPPVQPGCQACRQGAQRTRRPRGACA